MKFVSEKVIDRWADRIGTSEGERENVLQDLQEEQGVVLGYVFSENFQAFLQTEKEYILYLLLVIYASVREVNEGNFPDIDEDLLGDKEEENWNTLLETNARRFRDRLNPFFAGTPQEDLLAFVEDALLDEEDGLISKEGREPMFICLKTIIDCFTADADAANG